MATILCTDLQNIGEDLDYQAIESLGNLISYKNISQADLASAVSEHKPQIIVSNRTALGASVLKLGYDHGLRFIGLTATGTNTVDLEVAQTLGIKVANVKDYSTHAVAELTLLCALLHLRKPNHYAQFVASGAFIDEQKWTHFSPQTNELRGKKWGIIGLGSIGRQVAKLALAFSCEPTFASISGVSRAESIKQVSLDQLLSESDIISIHAPLSPESENLINMAGLKKCKKSAIIINMGRGGIVNEGDLALALKKDLIDHAYLDVLRPEPPLSSNPLLSQSLAAKITIFPHIAWAPLETRQGLVDEVALNIKAFLRGENRNLVT